MLEWNFLKDICYVFRRGECNMEIRWKFILKLQNVYNRCIYGDSFGLWEVQTRKSGLPG